MIYKFLLLTFILLCESASASTKNFNRILEKNHSRYIKLEGYQAEGKATYYAKKFRGRKTASGMKYLKDSYTAASKRLPLFSVVKVTNPKSNKTVSVLINDRGNFSNTLIDLSEAAAKAIKLSSNDKIILEFDLESTLALENNKKLLARKFNL